MMDVPPTQADPTGGLPRPIVPEMTTSTTAPAPAPLSPVAYMGIGFAAASALGLVIALLWWALG